jgi:hypothetical protein
LAIAFRLHADGFFLFCLMEYITFAVLFCIGGNLHWVVFKSCSHTSFAYLVRIPFFGIPLHSNRSTHNAPWCSLDSRCIPWDLSVHSHTILFNLVLRLYLLVFLGISLYSFVFLGISLYSLRYLRAFAYHSVLLSVPCVFPCIPWNLVVFLRIPWNLVVFHGISLYIRIPFCST